MIFSQLSKFRAVVIGAALLLIAIFVISVATGPVSLSPSQIWRTILGQGTSKDELILYTFRFPRILITILAGMGLALSGAILQSVTRNPLADPGILGINAGAGLMVVIYVMFFTIEPTSFLYILPLFALMGGLLTAAIIYLLSYRKGEGLEPTRLLIVGVGMAAVLYGITLTLTTRFDREQYLFIANWMAGRIWGDEWPFVLALLPWLILFVPIVFAKAKVLNALNLHENIAVGLGVHVAKERRLLLIIAVALAAASVSVSGGIAFVGLMAPHIAKALVGPRHQRFLPVSAMLGAALLLIADTIGRALLGSSGIPAGIIVTIIGAPYFMYLMAKK